MKASNVQSNEIIFILGNQDGEIKYSNMDGKFVHNYIEKLNILDNLDKDLPLQYILEGYYVKIDKYIALDEVHNIVTIKLKRSECESCVRASIDTVTGLYNRNYLERVKRESTFRDIRNSFLILIDIDDLKKINDNHGHLVGDKAIELVGQSIMSSIRKEDIGIRYGGDEFIVMVFNKNKNSIKKVVERIKGEISKRNAKENINVKISTGVAYCNHFEELEGVIQMADTELYKEKKMKEIEV